MPVGYSTTQKSQIADFARSLQIDKTTAAKLLKASAWSAVIATQNYFDNETAAATTASKAKLSKLFDQYRDDPVDEPDEINIEGTMKMMNDLEIDVEDVAAFVFAELVQSPSLGKMERQGFTNNLAKHSVSDLLSLKALVAKRRAALSDPQQFATFRSIYKHAFIIARPAGQKSVPLEMATEYWKALLRAPSLDWSTPTAQWLDWWLEFLEARAQRNADKDSYRSVNKDTWDQTLAFANKTLEDPTLSWWSEDSAWPSVIDEFVDFLKAEKHVGGAEAMDTA